MKTNPIIFAAIAALSLIPTGALGQEAEIQASKASTPKFKELTASEVNSTFWLSFKAVKEGSDPNSKVTLYGMVFEDCEKHFKITNSAMNGSLKGDGIAGFMISDPSGNGRTCMADHRTKEHSCSDATPCKRLSDKPGASMDLSGIGDGRIQMLHIDQNQGYEKDRNVWESIPTLNSDLHKTREKLQAEQREAADARRQAKIEAAQGQLGCRKTLEDISNAHSACTLLMSMKVMSSEECEKVKKQLDRAEFDLLARSFKKIKVTNEEALNESLEALKAFEAEHPEVAESIALMLYEKAKDIATATNAGASNFDAAAKLISEAQGLSGLQDNADAQAKLAGYQRDIQLGKMQKLAQSGAINPAQYMALMNQTGAEVRACAMSYSSSDACQGSQRAFQVAQQLPYVVQAAQQQQIQQQIEQYNFYARMQQTFASMGMGSIAGGPFTAGSMTPGMLQQQQGSGFYR